MNEYNNSPYYTVYASNSEDEKAVATSRYKRDAIRVSKRFLNASVVRTGRRGDEREVYAHAHAIPDKLAHVFTHTGLKQAKAAA